MHSLARVSSALLVITFVGCGDSEEVTGAIDTTAVVDTQPSLDTTPDLEVVDFDTNAPPSDTSSSVDTSTPPTDTEEPPPSCDDDPKPFFCPCDFNPECASGFCVPVDETEVAARCSRTCQQTCPMDWQCKGVGAVGDPVFICVPPVNNLCKPCFEDADCNTAGDKCLSFDDGNFCGRDCSADANVCPDTYSCAEITDDLGQITAYQCSPVSGSCQCPPGTDYANDPLNCGTCKSVCEIFGANPGCAGGQCYLDTCKPGFVNLDAQNDNGCEYECSVDAGAEDWPEASCNGSDCDQNCDGIDGTIARGVFVATNGSSDGLGTMDDPLDTITRGIAKAEGSAGLDHVYIAAGTYSEQVVIKNGISIFGGYSTDGKWQRNLAQFETLVSGGGGAGSVRTIIVDNVDAKTVIDGVKVVAENNTNPSGSSYGIWVRNSTGLLTIVRTIAIGGNGGAGTGGNDGNPGSPGVVGQPGVSTSDTDCNCNEFDDYGGDGGVAGTNQCSSGTNARGGRGGDSDCGGGTGDNGSSSGAGVPGGSGGGEESNGIKGSDGGAGANGAHGEGGAGGTVSSAGFWNGNHGEDGVGGKNGQGGGGGGGGGGDKNGIGCAVWGGGGGGGASGGCGATKGTRGLAGGGSFGLFLYDASPRLIDSQFGHKNGGNGGSGGKGGSGGAGKNGGAGGSGHKDAGNGGRGGNSGKGGNGGNGGGGAGGVAYGLFIGGSSAPECTNLGFAPPGSGGGGGIGGVGGTTAGNKGSNGAAGDKNKSTSKCP